MARRRIGLVLLVSLVAVRSLVYYMYTPGVIDVWHWVMGVFTLVPIDGIVALFYCFWSGDMLLAFLLGFLPSVLALFVPIARLAQVMGVSFYVLLGLLMGMMGAGGVKYRSRRNPSWLIAVSLAWLLTWYFVIMAST